MTTATNLRADPAAIKQFAEVFMEPDQVYEVRITDPKSDGPARLFGRQSGYFDNPDDLTAALQRITGDDAEAIYVTLNPVEPDLQARAVNRMKQSKTTTSDTDIVRRRTLLIDVDPTRPSGVSATREEQKTARRVRQEIFKFLTDYCGWSEPLAITVSGNGAGLLYRIDLPARRKDDEDQWEPDPESTDLIQRVLDALNEHFGTKQVEIDTGVANPSRLTKVVGTISAKGDNTESRPWRMAIAQYPEHPGVVTRDQLEVVAALKSEPESKQDTKSGSRFTATAGHSERRWTIDELLQLNGLNATPQPKSYGTSYDLDRCLTSDEHTDGACLVEINSGALVYRCQHNSCQGKDWSYIKDHGLVKIPGQSERSEAFVGSNGHRPLESQQWPEPLDDAAFHGLAGEIVNAIDSTTEADRAAVLMSLLTAVGNAVGSRPHWRVSGRDHGLRLNTVLVGETSKGRKGTARGSINPILRVAAPQWVENRIASGLSSGEGLIWGVRDAIYKLEPVREKKQVVDYQTVMVDPGVADKRLLVIEEEFSGTLRVMAREGSTLSAIIRQAWDDGDLRTLTKNSPAKATGAHISILGHTTQDELLRYLDSTETGNGFANRFLWVCVRRSKVLPHGGQLDSNVIQDLGTELRNVIEVGSQIDLIQQDSDTLTLWERVYEELSEGKPGLMGAILSRAEAQVMRLAAIYAVLDCSSVIRPEHLRAALAIWDYAEASVEYVFGDALGDPVADTILSTLRQVGPQSRTDLRDLFGRHMKSGRIDRALGDLFKAGKVQRKREDTGGRPRDVWFAV
jgi:phenylpyruvate tautomerase PptA (4-oxalocrotonate tautomerase family)